MNTSTADITRGVERLLQDMGYATLREMTLPNWRRVDVIGLNKKGELFIVEVKSSRADFQNDEKWQKYLTYADRFCFGVDMDFPQDILPHDCGLIIADNFEGTLIRSPYEVKLGAARRKKMMLTFARTAANRLREDRP